MFNFLKNKLKKVYNQFTSKINSIFARKQIDEETLKELEIMLLQSDTGAKTTRTVMENIREQFKANQILEGQSLKEALKKELSKILTPKKTEPESKIHLMVGINGSGKTTFSGKLANKLKSEGKKVLMVAADTFRAAATEQLEKWAESTSVAIETGTQGQDPASVVFKGIERYKKEQFDIIIIDTAGRLQTKTNLMKELEKIKKIINRHLPNENINTLLTIDSMLGQNSLEQAKIFNESTKISGIVLTKMDGTGKGGIVFAISKELGIPINYISFGENLTQLKYFDSKEYVEELLGK